MLLSSFTGIFAWFVLNIALNTSFQCFIAESGQKGVKLCLITRTRKIMKNSKMFRYFCYLRQENIDIILTGPTFIPSAPKSESQILD